MLRVAQGGTRRGSCSRGLLSVALALVPVTATAAVAPQLQGLLRQARIVVAGDVAEVTPYDDGRVAVATVHVTKRLKGELPGDRVLVVEMRDRPNAAPVFQASTPVVLFLRPADKNSYLRKHLPSAEYYQTISGHSAYLAAKSPEEAAQTRALVERVARMQQMPESDAQRRAEADRTLTFDLIAARNAVLVQDGALSLGDIPGLAATLRVEERRCLETAVGRDDLPSAVRVSLIKGIGAAKLEAMVPVLRALHGLPADVQEAVWAALTQLGAPPKQEEWEQQLASGDAERRAAAVREYLRATGAEGIPRAAAVALHDPDQSVRVAAIEALGKTERPEALPPLQQAFDDPSAEIYQAAVRAISEIGGRPAAETLAKLAVEAPPQNQRLAVVALMVMVGPDDPLVTQIKASHPNPAVRDLIEHGFNKLGH
jgi:HEAT repeat protein